MSEDVFGIVGTTQGPYRVESVVAEGGFGVVYRAYHDAFRAPVALKCLKVPGTLGEKAQAEFLERFREEAEVMFRLSASIPAVVRPLHADVLVTNAGQFVPFMALEWLDGETLDVLVAKRKAEGRPPLSLKRLVRMLAPVARALERAHNFPGPDGATVSIVHCDLKPDNIFLIEADGVSSAKILDFGIAKVRDAASQIAGRISQVDATGNAFTPGYAAPEQWLPKRFGQAGPWTDVWGLALTVIEAALGRPVIDGDHASMMGTAIDEARRPTPRTEGLLVSDEVEAVFARALAVDPRRRHQDVGLFWDELERAFGLEPSGAVVRRDHRAEGAGPAVREERIDLGGPRPSSFPPLQATTTMPSAAPAPAQVPQPTVGAPLGGSFVARPMNPSVWPAQGQPAPRTDTATSAANWTASAPSRTSTPAPISPPSGLSFGGEIELTDDEPGQAIALDLDPLHRQGPPSSTSAKRSFDGRPIPTAPRHVAYEARRAQADLGSRLAGPLRAALGGIAIAGVEMAYMQIAGAGPIMLGPVRLLWIAAGIVVVGTVVLLARLFWPAE